MEFDNLTMIFSGIVLVVIIAYDVWTLVKRGYNTTISANLYFLAYKFPIIAFSLGIVCGHLFWPNQAAVCNQTKVIETPKAE